jgi:ATP-dependent DNA helicase DinG
MLLKSKQGAGRLLRTERDTGIIAILDCRAGEGGAYRTRLINALPSCRVTKFINDVKDFLRLKKPLEYWD